MNKRQYSDNEINLLLERVESKVDSNTELTVRVLEQATKTNGRVNKLERNLLVLACITATVVILKYEEVMSVVTLFL